MHRVLAYAQHDTLSTEAGEGDQYEREWMRSESPDRVDAVEATPEGSYRSRHSARHLSEVDEALVVRQLDDTDIGREWIVSVPVDDMACSNEENGRVELAAHL